MDEFGLDAPLDSKESMLSALESLDFTLGDFSKSAINDENLGLLQVEWVNYSDDFIDSLLASQTDDDTKTSASVKDHNYTGVLPKSPSSDSGNSSGSRSPYGSSSSGIATVEMEDELFGPLDLARFDSAGNTESLGEDDSMQEKENGSECAIDFDLDFDGDGLYESNSSLSLNKGCHFSLETTKDGSFNLPFTVKSYTNANDTHVTSPTAPHSELRLSDEEKELLKKEGVALPTNMPLTKSEERILRSVRRRIRNKQSARNSRKKKQDYMDNLEERVKLCSDEKKQLEKKVTVLEKQNMFLITQLRKLQVAMKVGGNKPARTTTCVLVLAMSFALFVFPSIRPFGDWDNSTKVIKSPPMAGRSRNLLEVSESEEPRTKEPFWKTRSELVDPSSLNLQPNSKTPSRMGTSAKDIVSVDILARAESGNTNLSYVPEIPVDLDVRWSADFPVVPIAVEESRHDEV